MNNGWIGVDFDGTLAFYDGWKGVTHLGSPIPEMVDRVKRWIADGKDVRIFTARVSHDSSPQRMLDAQHSMIEIMDWCTQHIGKPLPVTCMKDYAMLEIWDDRAVQVVANLGSPVGHSTRGFE